MTTALTETEQYDETVDGPAGGEPRTGASVRAMGAKIVNRTKWLAARLAEIIGTHIKVSAASASTDKITTVAAHGLSGSDPIRFISVGGSVPSGLSAGVVYYLLADTSTTFKVSATPGGSAIDLTSSGSGTIYVYKVIDALAAIFAPAAGSLPAGSLRTILGSVPAVDSDNEWSGAQQFDELEMMGTATIELEARSIIRTNEASEYPSAESDWSNASAFSGAWQTTVNTASSLVIPLHIPDGATLTAVTLYFVGAGAHAGLPASMPTLKIYKFVPSTGTRSQIGATVTDTSADTAAYQAVHAIQRAGLSEVVNRATARYVAVLTSESGANALSAAKYWGATVTYTATKYDED